MASVHSWMAAARHPGSSTGIRWERRGSETWPPWRTCAGAAKGDAAAASGARRRRRRASGRPSRRGSVAAERRSRGVNFESSEVRVSDASPSHLKSPAPGMQQMGGVGYAPAGGSGCRNAPGRGLCCGLHCLRWDRSIGTCRANRGPC